MNTTNNTNSKHDQSYLNASKNAPVPCGVIRDLLILYEDDVCSEESSRIIKEGLKCLAGYNSMRILPDGTITSCLETQRIPNFNLDNDTLLDYAYTPITCPSTWCNCIVYTRLPKWNPQHTECPTYFKNNSQ